MGKYLGWQLSERCFLWPGQNKEGKKKVHAERPAFFPQALIKNQLSLTPICLLVSPVNLGRVQRGLQRVRPGAGQRPQQVHAPGVHQACTTRAPVGAAKEKNPRGLRSF